ncbi:MAG: serine hydrolase domain-containing protein [Acidimicrobiia bacterium]
MAVAVEGYCAPGYEKVATAFAANFATEGDVGGAVAVYRDGLPIIDLWAGIADLSSQRPWTRDTIVGVFSITKGLTTIAAHLLAQRGLLDLDAPVARYWPQFAANGKAEITVRMVMSHRAGLAHAPGTFTLDEALSWTPIVDALADAAPQWEPGTQHGYHMRTFGWLVGEIIRRVSGAPTPGTFFADEIATPLGLSTWIGLPEQHDARCATLIPPDFSVLDPATLPVPGTLRFDVATGPSGLFRYDEMWNTRRLRAAELPSSNAVTDARSLARLYAACIGTVDGVRILDDRTVTRACEVQSIGPDMLLSRESCFGVGFMRPPMLNTACGPRSFGHGGAGGSASFADPDQRLGFGYVMNHMRLDEADPRVEHITNALYECLD